MNYLLRDSRSSRNRGSGPWSYVLLVIVVLAFLFFVNSRYVTAGRFFSFIGRPFYSVKEDLSGSFSSLGSYFESKNALVAENKTLTQQLADDQAAQTNTELISQENDYLKGVFGRTQGTDANLVLAGVLAGPGTTLYDTLLLDVGADAGVKQGDVILIDGVDPIGSISEVYAKTSLATLYSSPGQQTSVIIAGVNLPAQALGRGDGNFEIVIPQNITIGTSTDILLPGLSKQVIGSIDDSESDLAHSTETLYFRSPFDLNSITTVFIQE